MRSHVRVSLLALLVGALVAVMAPAAAQAAFGVEKFFAGNCIEETCGEGAKAPSLSEEETKGYRLAGGKVPFGVTDFVFNNKEGEPEGNVEEIRVDVAPGVVTNPEAVTRCSIADFTSTEVQPGVFLAPKCPASSIIGKQVAVVQVAAKTDFPLKGTVYNLEQANGLGSEFGVALELEPVFKAPVFAHSLIEGNVEWASDYHDYFIIKDVSKTLPLVESRLVFEGTKATTLGFLRNPTACTTPGPETTTTVTVKAYTGETASLPFTNKVGSTECNLGFDPSFELSASTALSDQPDGITTNLIATHPEKISDPDTADLKSATVTLPEGMTINPSAAAGLEGCTRKQIGIETRNDEECPGGSKIGTVELEVPTLPAHALTGSIFLGKPEGKAIEGPPYKIYLDAESSRYGVKVRTEGTVTPNAITGRLETTFKDTAETPNNIGQAPFDNVIMHFKGGAFAPIANPLCGTGTTNVSFEPFSGSSVSPVTGELPFATEGCTTAAPFAPTQETSVIPATGGSDTDLTFTLTRPEGQQYVEKVSTTLPAGVVGKIPSVPLCAEAQANATQASGQGCSAASQIGTVRVAAGSGEPYPFTGKVYLTGPYQGAPYGLSIKVPVIAGPFNLGEEVTRATISVDPHSTRVTVASKLPTIKAGIPIRMRSLTVDVSRPNYILNPTSCDALKTESVLTSTLGTTASISSPFQAEGCSSLGFKPKFAASTSGKFSKNNGASLVTKITQPASQANIKSVVVTLPKQLPSRLTTLQKSCPEATFAANPLSCNAESNVGTATVVTPVLPGKMTGPAYLVSHGGAAFPDLDLVLESNGVRVILIGNTDIKNGITTSSFATNPDVPVSSVEVNLPTGPHSALAAFGNLCTASLVMPTTMTAQNGKQFKQNTKISPTGCGVQIVGHKVVGNTAYVTVKTFAAGRITGSGSNLSTVRRTLKAASKAATLKIPLSSKGKSKRRPLKVKVRVGFVPTKKGAHSSASVSLTFRR